MLTWTCHCSASHFFFYYSFVRSVRVVVFVALVAASLLLPLDIVHFH